MPWEPPSPTGLGPPEGTLAAFQMHRESSPRSGGSGAPQEKERKARLLRQRPPCPDAGKARAGSAVLVTKSKCLRPSKSDQTATGATQPRLARAAAPEPPSQQEPEVGRVPDVAGPDAYRRHSRGGR